MKKLFVVFCLLSASYCFAQQHKTKNLIIVTMDGLRWQEVFGGRMLKTLDKYGSLR